MIAAPIKSGDAAAGSGGFGFYRIVFLKIVSLQAFDIISQNLFGENWQTFEILECFYIPAVDPLCFEKLPVIWYGLFRICQKSLKPFQFVF